MYKELANFLPKNFISKASQDLSSRFTSATSQTRTRPSSHFLSVLPFCFSPTLSLSLSRSTALQSVSLAPRVSIYHWKSPGPSMNGTLRFARRATDKLSIYIRFRRALNLSSCTRRKSRPRETDRSDPLTILPIAVRFSSSILSLSTYLSRLCWLYPGGGKNDGNRPSFPPLVSTMWPIKR